MRKDTLELLKSIQKNAGILADDMELLKDKSEDKALCMELSKSAVDFSKLHDRAKESILKGDEEPYRMGGFEDMHKKNRIGRSTLLNISTSHVAEIAIRENQTAMRNVWKAVKHFENAGDFHLEFAKEFLALQETTIERLKKYL